MGKWVSVEFLRVGALWGPEVEQWRGVGLPAWSLGGRLRLEAVAAYGV